MNKIREILRLFTDGHSKNSICDHTGISRNTIKKYLSQYLLHRLTYQEIESLSDKDLDDLFGKPVLTPPTPRLIELVELFPYFEKELKRRGVTKRLLWQEYSTKHLEGFGFTQFCHYYSVWKNQSNPVMHFNHKAGDKLFVDYAGDKLQYTDIKTGEILYAEVFVAILGASQLTYVEAFESQKVEDFIGGCVGALEYIGGVPAAIVPDNLKSAVIKSNNYEPTLNETFADFAAHYGTSILPARSRKPRDKALVENAVRLMYTRIYAVIRNQAFSSLAELNHAIRGPLDAHNDTPFSRHDTTRKQQFEEIERKELKPLPPMAYELKYMRVLTVMKNYHVYLSADKHYYSVPYDFVGKKIKLYYSHSEVLVYYRHEKIATHPRLRMIGKYSTIPEHMPSTHRAQSEWSAERFLSWADSMDASVRELIQRILEKNQHPEQGYKTCLGILSFDKKVGRFRFVNACKRALEFGIYNYNIVRTILEKRMDEYPQEDTGMTSMPAHENIRGEKYYQ
jgi:transposase